MLGRWVCGENRGGNKLESLQLKSLGLDLMGRVNHIGKFTQLLYFIFENSVYFIVWTCILLSHISRKTEYLSPLCTSFSLPAQIQALYDIPHV